MADLLSRGDCRAILLFKALTEDGWQHDRISGSHHIFTRAGSSCLPVAVHGGKVRRDVAYHVLRRASLPEALAHDDDDDEPSVALTPTVSPAAEAEANIAPPRRVAVDHCWAEASNAERELHRVSQERVAEELSREREAFRLLLREVQREILDGDYAAVHARLSPVLGSCTEDALGRLIERIGYDLIGDALFFFSNASGHLATNGGDAGFGSADGFGSAEQQQLIVAAFATCKRLLERFREKRAEARALLRSLLSHVYTLYLGRLMDLAMSQIFEECDGATLARNASRHLAAALGEDEADDTQFVPIKTRLSADLDRINASLRSGLNFIVVLARAEQQLVMLTRHEMGPMHEGIIAVTRANIVHYERGALQEGKETFSCILWLLEQQRESLDEHESFLSAKVREKMATETLAASITLNCSTTLRAMAEACIRMQPAHKHAAETMLWSRGVGFDNQGVTATEQMRSGWSAVLHKAKEHSAASKPFKWKALCEFMRLYFEGLEYSAVHSVALCNGMAGRFVVDNLRDPVYMIAHQCEQLQASSKPLDLAHSALKASLAAKLQPDPHAPAYEGLNEQSMQSVRQQLVTMLRWLVQLRGLYHRLDGIIRFFIRFDKSVCSDRFHGYHAVVQHVSSLLECCCIVYHRSTLLDLFEATTIHTRGLDFFLYRDLCGGDIQSLRSFERIETQNGALLVKLKDALPGYLKWFMTTPERSKLAVRFGLMHQLMGFSLTHPALVDNMQKMRAGTECSFCVFAIEMVELLHQMGTQSITHEAVAEVMVACAKDAPGSLPFPPGMYPSDRRLRRSPEVQKTSRRVTQLVDSIRALFPAAVLAELCEKRRLHLGTLEAIYERMLSSLRTAAHSVGSMGTLTRNGAGVRFERETCTRLGELLPDWTPQDLHDINLHALALAELASEVNVQMQAVFGGNFPALVWLNDCYEYDQNYNADCHEANQAHNNQLCEQNERDLHMSVLCIRELFNRGHFTAQPVKAVAQTQVDGFDDAAPCRIRKGGGKQVADTSSSTAHKEPAKTQAGKKKKGKAKR